MRLIDADELLKHSCKVTEYDEAGFSMEYNAVATEEVKNAPTVDAVPVVRGEWVKGIYGWSNHLVLNCITNVVTKSLISAQTVVQGW